MNRRSSDFSKNRVGAAPGQPATAENRVLTDRLARDFAGIDQGMER